ncbi:hypothetical protein [Streptomyces sp. NPDC059015]|uniref:hypothetical protein n=1 Tax=unclassified Streptomyces TaxID=2593676 RepID=UPI0036D0ED62
MRSRTLTPFRRQHALAGWSHPYPVHPFSPVFYNDGGSGDQQATTTGTSADDKPDTGPSSTDKTGANEADDTDWKAEAEKYKALSRKHETRAKENATAAKERDELKRQAMSDQERAVDEAAAKARAEERVRLAGKLARQGFLAAAAGRIPHAATVADDLNLSKYIAEDGEVDEKGLAELVDRLAPKAEKKQDDDGAEKPAKQSARGFDQGPRGTGAARKGSSVASGRDLWAQRKQTTSI